MAVQSERGWKSRPKRPTPLFREMPYCSDCDPRRAVSASCRPGTVLPERSLHENRNARRLALIRSRRHGSLLLPGPSPTECRLLDLTPDEWTAILLSLRIAIVATLAALPFGIAMAWLLARK